MLRKWFLSTLAVGLLLAGLPVSLVFAAAASYEISADQTSVGVNKALTVTVKASELKNVYGYEIVLSYDTTKLSLQSANNLLPKNNAAEQNGFAISPIKSGSKVTFAYTKVGSATGSEGSKALAAFTFGGLAAGKASVKIESVKLVHTDLTSEKQTPDKSVQVYVLNASREFTDVAAGFWAKDAITRAAQMGFVNGYPDGTFKPLKQVTRAEFVTMLARALELPVAEQQGTDFKDNERIGNWAKPSIASGVAAGWIKGFEDGTFRPDLPITRAEMTVIVVRALKLDTAQDGQLAFADAASIPSWAKDAVAAAVKAGLVNGRGSNKFVPSDSANRAEAVTLILRMVDEQK
ncbi:S-layer homology domain-containing protein [Paenibacillus sp. JDR-2]|uniref:S-layer homology domain-containing protein n=1 Tax=Paenibacillus sp. (strain JDR-2) TaxID=324057 RepID=UPI0001664717|nr:S-layer homology domain-containing protein [Paenibacillus sp. JDR-2]ACT03722.1 S-layer domain protein [Paenibacillus sp. JDR-2]